MELFLSYLEKPFLSLRKYGSSIYAFMVKDILDLGAQLQQQPKQIAPSTHLCLLSVAAHLSVDCCERAHLPKVTV